MTIQFIKNTDGYKNLATYVSQLIISGITFQMHEHTDHIKVELTGGY